MSQVRFARIALMLAAIGLNAAPALMHSASAQDKNAQPAAAAKPPADSVRPEMFKLLDPAQIGPLITAKNYTEVQTRISQAEALPNPSPYETYVINRMKLSLASATNNEQGAQAAIEALLASGKVSDADKPNYTTALAGSYYRQKNYPKAIETYKQLQASGQNTDAVNQGLLRAYYFSGDYANAVKLLGPMIDAEQKAGKTPSDQELQMYASAANKVKDEAAYMRGLEMLATYYPNDDYWTDMLSRGVLRKPGYDRAYDTDYLRLKFQAVQKMEADEYTELAELAMKDGFPTEAKKAMDAGFAAGVLGTGGNAAKQRQLRDRATKDAANDVKGIAATEASASKSKTGAGLINLGWDYVTMDQFDKGIGFIEQGIAKGGTKLPDEGKLRLGMAYARAGQKDKAIQTFQSINGKGGAADLAHYWIMLLNRPAQGAAAAK